MNTVQNKGGGKHIIHTLIYVESKEGVLTYANQLATTSEGCESESVSSGRLQTRLPRDRQALAH